jgi:hypothetical protein
MLCSTRILCRDLHSSGKTKCIVAIPYRRFGTAYRSHIPRVKYLRFIWNAVEAWSHTLNYHNLSVNAVQGNSRRLSWDPYRFHHFYRPRRPLETVEGTALLCFLDLGTSKGCGISVTPRPLSTSGKDPVPIVQETKWAPRPVWTGAENLAPTGIRSPNRPARQPLYRLSYRAHWGPYKTHKFTMSVQNVEFL